MARPHFVVIGAQKCGTTALHAYLRQHPDIFMPSRKELNFFRDDGNYPRGVHWYETFFNDARDDQILGEASPQYARAPDSTHVASRMYDLLPQAKLIYSVRDPFDRMRSAWQQEVARGRESRPLGKAILQDHRYLDHSCYSYQLDAFLAYYDPTQILVVDADRLRADRRSVLGDIFTFLGVSPAAYDFNLATPEVHRSQDKHRPLPVAAVMANTRIGRAFKKVTPLPVKRRILRTANKPVGDSHMPLDAYQQVRPILAEDARKLVPLMPPDFSGWGLL